MPAGIANAPMSLCESASGGMSEEGWSPHHVVTHGIIAQVAKGDVVKVGQTVCVFSAGAGPAVSASARPSRFGPVPVNMRAHSSADADW